MNFGTNPSQNMTNISSSSHLKIENQDQPHLNYDFSINDSLLPATLDKDILGWKIELPKQCNMLPQIDENKEFEIFNVDQLYSAESQVQCISPPHMKFETMKISEAKIDQNNYFTELDQA